MTRRCTRLFSNPRVVRIAAAVQPKPSSSEKTARPVSPTRRNMPSVMNAKADIMPLSSIKKRAKYSTASCGKKEKSIPKQEKSEVKKSSAARLPPRCASPPNAPPIPSENSRSMPSFAKTAGENLPNASAKTAASSTKNSGSAKRPYSSRSARPSPRRGGL